MPKTERLLVLPADLPLSVNPARKYFAAHCEPEGFIYPYRVKTSPKVFSVLDRYEPLNLPDWWRGGEKDQPFFGTRAEYSVLLNTFFEAPGKISKIQELHRAAHETAHAVIVQMNRTSLKADLTFQEGLAEWTACEVLTRAKAIYGVKNWHVKSLEWRLDKAKQARLMGIYSEEHEELNELYMHGLGSLYEVMSELFVPTVPVTDQLRFILANYDPTITGDYQDRRDFIDYARVVMEASQEQEAAIVA